MDLTVYTAFWCGDCREAKRFLAKYNIPYKEVDIESTPGAAEEVIRNTAKRAIPQFVIDGEWFQPYDPREGFLYDEMVRRLGIEFP
jgi:mycoredoxin